MQNLCRTEAVNKKVGATILRFLQAVKDLQSRHGIAIWIVGVRAESQLCKCQIVWLRGCSDLKNPSVIRLSDPPDHCGYVENFGILGGYARKKRYTFVCDSLEPFQAHHWRIANLVKRIAVQNVHVRCAPRSNWPVVSRVVPTMQEQPIQRKLGYGLVGPHQTQAMVTQFAR